MLRSFGLCVLELMPLLPGGGGGPPKVSLGFNVAFREGQSEGLPSTYRMSCSPNSLQGL